MGQSFALIGAGRMGQALATGWLNDPKPPHISIVAPRPSEVVSDWATTGRVDLNPSPTPTDTVVIAVKPQVFPSVIEQIKAWIGPDTLVMSVMAGISIGQLVADLSIPRVVRAMPNTPGAVGKGVTLISGHESLSAEDIETTRAILAPLGAVEGPMDETTLQVATAISGCGPAYGFLLAEAMAEAGIAHGLEPDLAHRLARQTVIGSGFLMDGTETTAADLRKGVTSPGGVTAEALRVLMAENGISSLMKEAVKAAIARDRELSQT